MSAAPPARWTADHFIAGEVALDFANTVYRRTPELGADLLTDGKALAEWFHHAGLLTPAGDGEPSEAELVLAEARVLRRLFWALFDAQSEGRDLPTAALGELLGLAQTSVAADISVAADGTITPGDLRGAFAYVALRGLTLTLSPPPRRVRTCDRCGWFFLDSSRGRRRRWCSMKTCGNQSKAARYRAAHS
ncbi:protein of unknown function DUF1470 [Kribbella flavida DSM 17836]|uniref:Zinc finger CGNR domain-containing protein n=1 Tax=Kribbella flavida (strain DSM 17836 / JCM 10339 / NBRC 14399) TaxID=479435 RepID=D2PLU5_KRIFD|nr:ABATE domain-containing protein [Kribbella flavida]ADB32525.1 protein of unknown function DUF1470 [Kribbella flavida DSM 17836]